MTGRAEDGQGSKGRKAGRKVTAMRSRAGLEAECVRDEAHTMKPGMVECALAHAGLKGEGIVERAMRGEGSAHAKAICEAVWLEDQRGVWKYYTTEDDRHSMGEENLYGACARIHTSQP